MTDSLCGWHLRGYKENEELWAKRKTAILVSGINEDKEER